MGELKKAEVSYRKLGGPSPAACKYYVLVMFDISGQKKYRQLMKILKRYTFPIQKSVYESHLTKSKYKKLVTSIENLMSSKKFFNADDCVRIYRISGGCSATLFGEYSENFFEENIFI